MRPIALCAVLLLGLAALPAQSADLCNTVANTLSSLKPPSESADPWMSPIRTLEKESRGVVTIDSEGWRAETKEALLDMLRTEYRAGPELLRALEPPGMNATFHRFGTASLRLGQTVGGTAHCQHFVFFDAPAGREARPVADPPIVQTADETTFCFDRSAYAGEVAGVPAFIFQSNRDNVVELSVTPWHDGKWEEACRVTAVFANEFKVTNRFCEGVNCDAMADRALSLVTDLDDSSPRGFGLVNKLAGDAALDDQVPTFGGQVSGRYGSAYSSFAGGQVFLPVVVDRQMYVGRIGHAAFAWRTVPDYLFAAYRVQGDHLEPVAGLYITKTRTGPSSVFVR